MKFLIGVYCRNMCLNTSNNMHQNWAPRRFIPKNCESGWVNIWLFLSQSKSRIWLGSTKCKFVLWFCNISTIAFHLHFKLSSYTFTLDTVKFWSDGFRYKGLFFDISDYRIDHLPSKFLKMLRRPKLNLLFVGPT